MNDYDDDLGFATSDEVLDDLSRGEVRGADPLDFSPEAMSDADFQRILDYQDSGTWGVQDRPVDELKRGADTALGWTR
jgi:hypothetical protein